MNLRNIPRRLGNSLVIVIGIAGAVGVFIPIVAMSMSFRATIQGDGNDGRAIVLTHRAPTEAESSLTRDEVATIMDYPQVSRDARGKARGVRRGRAGRARLAQARPQRRQCHVAWRGRTVLRDAAGAEAALRQDVRVRQAGTGRGRGSGFAIRWARRRREPSTPGRRLEGGRHLCRRQRCARVGGGGRRADRDVRVQAQLLPFPERHAPLTRRTRRIQGQGGTRLEGRYS